QRLMGGASIGDLARLRFADDFTAAARPEEEPIDSVACRVLDLVARRHGAPYGGGALWVGAADSLPRLARLNLPSGKPAKEMRFTYRENRGAAPHLDRMEIDHLLAAEGLVHTTLALLDVAPRPLDAALFTPAGAGALP
ncbi:MAG TPA: outer membrane lipoprotein-sorting protein, partial [Dongiaceae bacterium]|nr:outer membrane lipoprotein-sorting protein [Dongiaceae bacterium]